MSDQNIQHRRFQEEHQCEFEQTLKGEYCPENREVRLDGLRLCNRHADRLRLEERAAYCRAMLAHTELWSREARSRGRDDVVHLLEIERLRTSAALERAYEALQKSQDGEEEEDGSGNGRAPPYGPSSSS